MIFVENMAYQPVPVSARKLKLPRLYLEKKDPTLWRGLAAPEGWIDSWESRRIGRIGCIAAGFPV